MATTEQETAMRNTGKAEQGHALVDGLILLIFLVIVPLLLLVYCGGRLRRVADWGASRLVCRRVVKPAPACVGKPCKKTAPSVKAAGEKPSAALSTAVNP